ncbi:MAG: hypothetical protein ACPLRW_05665 [Moorellales bacterium]
MIIVSDIDNCLGDLNVFLQERFGLDLSVYPAPLPDGFFSSPEGLEMLWKVRPFAGAAMSLWGAAANGFRLVYLSSRPREAAFVTRRWLAVHGFPPGGVVLTGDKVGWVLARRGEVFLVVEDDPRVALELAREGVPVYLIDWPYNRGIEHPRITRADGLPLPGVGAAARKEGCSGSGEGGDE